jgi:hypothetical protein
LILKMPKPSVTVDEKVSILLNKFRDDDVYNEFLNFAKGNFFLFCTPKRNSYVVRIYDEICE